MRVKPVNQRPVIHVCSFSDGIDDMKRADQRDPFKVLKLLHKCKRFSVFEVTANSTIAGTMSKLDGVYFERTGGAYPWIEVELNRKGLLLIGEPVPDLPPSNVVEANFGRLRD